MTLRCFVGWRRHESDEDAGLVAFPTWATEVAGTGRRRSTNVRGTDSQPPQEVEFVITQVEIRT